MKIKKNSWHYLLLNAISDVPNTLCAYIGKFIEIIVVLSIALYIVGSIVSFPFMVWFVDYNTVGWIGKISMMTGFSVLFIFIVGIGAGIYQFVAANWDQFVTDKLPQLPRNDEPETGMWYLTKQWLKAKKDKVCPLLEFTDDKEN